jgi:N-acetylglucosamine kinase-like BadF-type ATPase
MTRWFLGVDGGQSSTVALVGDETGRVLGAGQAGPCNHAGASGGAEKFAAALSGSVAAALQQAGAAADLRSVQFAAASLGFSGGPADKDSLTRKIVAAEKYLITHDAAIALAGAMDGAPGVIVIAGTGSIAFGENAEGHTARAGGWGYVFGDEGGAFDLVRQALRAALRQEEGWGPKTILREMLLEAARGGGDGAAEDMNVRDVNHLLHRFYTPEFPRDRVASMAKIVDDAAQAHDAVAGDILKTAAQSLATLAAAVRRQLFAPVEDVPMSYAGGVFDSRTLLERFRMLVELDDGNSVTAPVYGPAAGALLKAYQLAGIRCALSNLNEAA